MFAVMFGDIGSSVIAIANIRAWVYIVYICIVNMYLRAPTRQYKI